MLNNTKHSILSSLNILLTASFFVSCQNFHDGQHLIGQGTNPPISTEKLDTVRNNSYTVASRPAIFETAYFNGSKIIEDSLSIRFTAFNIGKINIETGKIIACDPILMHDATPYSTVFPIGSFPVQLAIAKIRDDERVAFSRIFFSENPVARWETALLAGQKPLALYDTSYYGYSVDGGIGLFIDSAANVVFNDMTVAKKDLWQDVFIREIDEHNHVNWQYVIYNFRRHNLATFSTGFGDGRYGTYIGYDTDGKICRLLTDFNIVDWSKK